MVWFVKILNALMFLIIFFEGKTDTPKAGTQKNTVIYIDFLKSQILLDVERLSFKKDF